MEDSIQPVFFRQKSVHVLPLCRRLAYSVGHVLNDLCASMWFSYLLVYLHLVLKFDNKLAGSLLLIGQIADGLATPFVGLQSDRIDDFWLCRYGRRKTWHLVGTICVLGSFPFLFIKCVGCENSHQSAQFVYYAAFIIIFQFGWASVQISHLSLIPDLTPVSCERVELNALRYAFTVVSNICVYGITWLYLDMNSGDVEKPVGPEDANSFRNIMLTVIAIGVIFSTLFHIFVKEQKIGLETSSTDGISQIVCNSSIEYSIHLHLTWKDWFKKKQFYIVGLLYMGTRLFVNLSQIYFPLYLQDTLKLHGNTIATIPLVIYVSGFVSSFGMRALNKKIGCKMVCCLAGIFGIAGCIWLYFGGDSNTFRYKELYGVAVVYGISGSAMLIASLSITSNLIGHNTGSGAFVFGAMSLIDKLSNGIVVEFIQFYHPCIECCPSCKNYYSYVLAFGCGGAAILVLVALMLLAPLSLQVNSRLDTWVSSGSTCTQNGKESTKKMIDPSVDSVSEERTPLLNGKS